MAAIYTSSSLRYLSPKPFHSFPKPPKNFIFFISSSPISFQTISKNPLQKSQINFQPLKSQIQETQLDLPSNLSQIITLFQSVSDPKSKYQQLLHYGTKLPPYPPQFKTDAYRVRGCVSQVWVRAYPDPNDPTRVKFDADSDSSLTKGLAALLVFGLSGESPNVVCRILPDFVQLLGLSQSLTPSRNNGFLNMLKLMQEKAAEIGGLEVSSQDEILIEQMDSSGKKNNVGEESLKIDEELEEKSVFSSNSNGQDEIFIKEVNNVTQNNDLSSNSRRGRIRERLEKELKPVELEIEDVSHMHAGHAGVRGNSGGETHFNLRVVSKEFEGKSMVKRHRLVYDLLKEELDSGLHALSIVAKTPSEV